jgi:hypothetical protein
MTWSLAITNGDLVLSNSDYATVTGEQKLIQDLTCFLLETMGTDPNHPDYGSLLDGGIDGGGTVYQSMLGLPNGNALSEALIQSELQRVLLAYQNMQIQRAKSDRVQYGKTTFSLGEVLLSVDSITMTTIADMLIANIGITTGNDTSVSLSVPLLPTT